MENELMELVANYQAYADAEELNVSAVSDAPASTVPCAIVVSSTRCVLAISAATYFSYQQGC